MKRYLFSSKTITSDVSAGITLGVESIPDGMANGLLAGVMIFDAKLKGGAYTKKSCPCELNCW